MTEVFSIKGKEREARLRYLGLVLTRDLEHPVRRAYEEPIGGW